MNRILNLLIILALTTSCSKEEPTISEPEKKQYPLTINILGEGSVEEEIIGQTKSATDYDQGTKVKLTAIPSDERWEFEEWTGDLTGSDNPKEILINTNKTVHAKFSRTLFQSKSPVYKYPNNASGENISNYYFPGNELITQHPWELINNQDENNFIIDGFPHIMIESGVNFLDIKNDGLLDMIGFFQRNDFVNISNGYFFILYDIFGDNELEIFETESWVVPRYDINDLNNDGLLDVLAYTSNSHSDIDGNYKTDDLPIKIYLFNPDGSFTSSYIGEAYSLHDGASGDVDNDGDVDVLVWGSKGPFPPNDIGLLLNDGNGNFIFNKEIIKVNNNRISDSFQSLAHRMIDLNNDGCVDIIAGDFFDEDWISDLGLYYPAIYWGNCTGEFVFDINTTENTTILPNKMVDNLDENYNYNVLGQNFIDYDYDGDLDIITSIAENTGTGYYLQLLENLGNKSFADRTSDLIQDNYGSGTFYRTRIYDVDNDGDFDIIPWHRDDLTRNIFWENIGGQFVKK